MPIPAGNALGEADPSDGRERRVFLVAVENTVGIAVISMVILGGGYLFVGALWYLMVYRPSREERRALAERTSSPAPAGDSEPHQRSDLPRARTWEGRAGVRRPRS